MLMGVKQVREIKFRAWFGEEHKMIPFDELHIELENGEYTVWYSLDGDSIQDGLCVEDFNIMQYTGLKDKSGQEIYEGDIVEVEAQCMGGRDFKGVVKFYECSFFIDNGEDAIPLFDEVDPRIVIGNIHDNPELLEVQND